MSARVSQNHRMVGLLVVVTMLHSALLLIPSVREQIVEPLEHTLLRVELKQPQRIAVPAVEPPPGIVEPVPPKISELPAPPATRSLVQQQAEPAEDSSEPLVNPRQLISRQFLMEQSERGAYLETLDAMLPVEDYFARARRSLNEVLNAPIAQLPFRDSRIYEVAYYDDGFEGAVDKFFDTVTVPFGFTTKGNTRIQCAWVLIVAGCAWDNKARFYRAAKKRRAGESLPY